VGQSRAIEDDAGQATTLASCGGGSSSSREAGGHLHGETPLAQRQRRDARRRARRRGKEGRTWLLRVSVREKAGKGEVRCGLGSGRRGEAGGLARCDEGEGRGRGRAWARGRQESSIEPAKSDWLPQRIRRPGQPARPHPDRLPLAHRCPSYSSFSPLSASIWGGVPAARLCALAHGRGRQVG